MEKREKRFYGKGAPKRFLIQKGKRRRVREVSMAFSEWKKPHFFAFFFQPFF